MTIHLLRGAGSFSGYEWRQQKRATVPLVNRPSRLPAACGADRPVQDVTDTEAKVTCGSCRRSVEYGDNYRRATRRQMERLRAARLRTAARNRALRALVDRHTEEFAMLYEEEHVLLALQVGNGHPPDEELPAIPGKPCP